MMAVTQALYYDPLGSAAVPLWAVAVGTAVCFTVFYAVVSPHVETIKGKAWVMTLLSAVVMSGAAGVTVAGWYEQSVVGGVSYESIFNSHTPFSDQMCVLFGVYLMADLLIGVLCYPKQIDPISGWVHHIGYTGLMYFCIGRCSVGWCIHMPLEVSTVLLAAGHINPKRFRADMIFGVSFFVFRIVYLLFLLSKLIAFQQMETTPHRICVGTTSAALIMHVWWWSNWASKHLFCGRKQTQIESTAAAAAAAAATNGHKTD